jgi:hypothetical protein
MRAANTSSINSQGAAERIDGEIRASTSEARNWGEESEKLIWE